MNYNDQRYLLALTFNGDINEEFTRLRADYRHYVDYDIVPHITLAFPFSPLSRIDTVVSALRTFACNTGPFTMVMDRVAYFHGANNGAYVAVRGPADVIRFNIGVIRTLEGLVRKYHADYDYNEFVPHMTIGERIPVEDLPSVKERFADTIYDTAVTVTDFTLFRDDDRTYRKEKTFTLGSS